MRTLLRLAPVCALSAIMMMPALQAYAEESPFSDMEKEEIGRLVRAYILENPEIIVEAVEILQQRERQAASAQRDSALAQYRDALENDENSPIMGNPDGDVTVVEFFDYNCGYCKRMTPELVKLLENDKNLRYVAKEWPIFGEGSEFAARAALAADKQGRYQDMHVALMSYRGQVTEEAVMKVAEEEGLDLARLREDMESPEITLQLELTDKLARAIGVQGTPAFIVGETFLPGAVPAVQLVAAIEETRATQ